MKTFLLSLPIVISSLANAASYQLFTNLGGQSTPVKGYEGIVNPLKKDDEVIFSNGVHITLGAKLGQGKLTAVFALADDSTRVVRIPIAQQINGSSGITKFPRKALQSFERERTKGVE